MIEDFQYKRIRRIFYVYLGVLLGLVLLLGILHGLLADYRAGSVWWFNLDKERNIPTWFNGVLYLLFGCAAGAAYLGEQRRNAEGEDRFHLPILWLGIGLIGHHPARKPLLA